jgi:hypothetical protein
LELFSTSFRKPFWIGPVPILLTNRPKLSVFMELSAVVEGQALVSAAYGYDYVIEYSYDRRRLTKFRKSSSFVPRDPLPTDPEFNLRINSAVELGVTFQWDVVLYELLQGSVSLDLALASSMEVGTNVDAMVVTSPYFYTLEKFKIDLLIRVRMMLGFNNNLQRIVRQITGVVNEVGEAFEHATSFKIPQFNSSLNELPAPLKEALTKAKADATLSDAKFISMAQLNALVPNPYTGVINALTGFDRDFALSYLVFSKEIFLFGLPVVSLEPASEGVEICQGSNAIAFTVESKIEKPAIPFRDGLAKGLWYTNFDGKLFHENSAWEVASARNNVKSISLRLPRSARSRPGFSHYEIESGATVYLRATPEILPVPYGMYEERSLTSMFTVPKFECCFDEDCTNNKNGNKCENIDGTNRCYFDQG